MLSAALAGLARGGHTAALLGYVALPWLGLPAAALGHVLASLFLRALGPGLTHLLVRALQMTAPAVPLAAALAGLRPGRWFGWWAGPGPSAALGAALVVAAVPPLVALAAGLTPAEVPRGAGGKRMAGGIAMRSSGFPALLRKEVRLIVRDPRLWGRLLAAPVAGGAIIAAVFRSQPILADPVWTATALGVFGAGMVGFMSDVVLRGEAERVPLLRLSPTPLVRLVAAKILPVAPVVALTAAAGGIYLAWTGTAGALFLTAAGTLAGTGCAWFNAEYQFQLFTVRGTVRHYAAAFFVILALFAASGAGIGLLSSGPVVGVTNLGLAGLLFGAAFLTAGRPRW